VPSFITPQNQDLAIAEHVAQLTENFQGLRNIPLSVTGINDAASFGLTLRNAGAGGKGLQVLNSAGVAIFTVQDSGVSGLSVTAPLVSPHMTGPVVDSGGLTVTAGGLTVTAGNVGIGGALRTDCGLTVTGATTAGAAQYGELILSTSDSGATTSVNGLRVVVGTAAAAFTSTTVAGIKLDTPSKGSGSTITSAYGLLVDPITSGNTNNYGIYIGASSGGSGENYGLKNMGTTYFNSIITMVNVPAFGASSKYLILDPTGIVRVSALGPAS
jgi:hypothetical protein